MNVHQIRAKAQLELDRLNKERNESEATLREFYSKNIFYYCVEKLHVRPETLDWTLYPEYKNHVWDGTPNPIMAIFEALQNNRWVRVKSAVGVQKTFTAACIALWFLYSFEGAYVPTTAPKEDQLLTQLWSEIAKLYKPFAQSVVSGQTKLLSGLLRMEDDVNTKYKAHAFVAGTSAAKDSEDSAQGAHAPHMLPIIEETPGVPPSVLKALINTCTGEHNLILALGNPNSRIDNFKEFDKIKRVVDIRISALDHPNVVLRKEVVPGAQTIFGLQNLKDKYGETHPLYLSRARGITPNSSIDSLIKAEWVDAAVRRYEQMCDANGVLDEDLVLAHNLLHETDNVNGLGVDVANSEDGDEAAICHGKGYVCKEIQSFPCPNSNELGDQVHQMAKDENVDDRNIGIDGIGVGAGTVNQMKKLGHSEGDINIIAGSTPIDIPDDEELFLNLRAQMWWKAREDFQNGRLAIPNDDDLIRDLLAPKWELMTDKKIKVESKKDLKKKNSGKSPNRGDAFVMWNWKKHALPAGYATTETASDVIETNSLTKQMGL